MKVDSDIKRRGNPHRETSKLSLNSNVGYKLKTLDRSTPRLYTLFDVCSNPRFTNSSSESPPTPRRHNTECLVVLLNPQRSPTANSNSFELVSEKFG